MGTQTAQRTAGIPDGMRPYPSFIAFEAVRYNLELFGAVDTFDYGLLLCKIMGFSEDDLELFGL